MRPEIRRAPADVDRHVQHLAANDAAQLGLRVVELVVEPPERVLDRFGMIVLNETGRYPEARELLFVVALKKEAPIILVHGRLYQAKARNRGLIPLHR